MSSEQKLQHWKALHPYYDKNEIIQNYYTKDNVDQNLATKSQLTTNYYNKDTVDQTLATKSQLTTNYYNKSNVDTKTQQLYLTIKTGKNNIIGGYTAPIIGYEETTSNNITTYTLLLSPESDDVDWTKFETGQTIRISLTDTVQDETDFITAEIATINQAQSRITLTQSIYGKDVTSSSQIGMIKKTVSGYVSNATGGYSSYRVTFNGAGNDQDLFEGRSIYTRAGTGNLVSNTISGVIGNYIYLGSAASGTTSIYLAPSTAFITDAIQDEDESAHANGEYNLVIGNGSIAQGAFNTVNGICTSVSGALNTIIGDNGYVVGISNNVAGVSANVMGVSNQITDGICTIIGDQNKIYKQGALIFGDMNTALSVGSSAFGKNNTIKAYGGTCFGTLNTIEGQYSVSIGYKNKIKAQTAYVIGRYAQVQDYAKNKNALIFWGGESQNNDQAFSVRVFREEENLSYNNSSLWTGYNGSQPNPKDSAGQKKYLSVPGYCTQYKGQMKPKTQTIEISGTQNVILDSTLFSRVKLTGTGAVSIDVEDYMEDGDKIELIVDTNDITVSIPSEWKLYGTDFMNESGLYVIEIAKIMENICYKVLWKI